MKKTLVVAAGSRKFCVDMKFVEAIHADEDHIGIVLSELKPNDSVIAEISTDSAPVSLNELIFKKADRGMDTRQLIVLTDNDLRFGLFVDSSYLLSDVADEAVQNMPAAFSSGCRGYFPAVVVWENEAIPVITPESIMELARYKFNENQAG